MEEILSNDRLFRLFFRKNMLMVISSTIDRNIEISKSMFEFIINFKSI